MSKKGENIYKRKDGRWEGRYIKFYLDSGSPKYGYIYGKTYGEVKRKLHEVLIYTGTGTPHNTKTVPFTQLLSDWLQSKRIHVKESTYARYKYHIESYLRPKLGQFQINKISTQLVEAYVEELLTNGRKDGKGGLAPKTVMDIIATIKSVIEYARYNEYPVICNLGKLTVKKKEKEMRVLNKAEQAALVSTLSDQMDLCKFGVLLCLYTGIRIGELCALKWENISVKERTLKIRETMQRIPNHAIGETSRTRVIITEPKSPCSIRDIPLPEFLIEAVTNFQGLPKAFVLTGEQGSFIEPRTMQNKFYSYIRQSGILKANFHSLRHTFATRCVEVGFEIKSLSEILGHANVNITLNKYVHSSFELKSTNMNKLMFPA